MAIMKESMDDGVLESAICLGLLLRRCSNNTFTVSSSDCIDSILQSGDNHLLIRLVDTFC